jgi:hypothetical protein
MDNQEKQREETDSWVQAQQQIQDVQTTRGHLQSHPTGQSGSSGRTLVLSEAVSEIKGYADCNGGENRKDDNTSSGRDFRQQSPDVGVKKI